MGNHLTPTVRRPVVYLDTQDYSRFGDVLRGKSNSETEELFTKLRERKETGRATFAVSMPILCELLQYDAAFRETTIKKAEAVEMLCGEWALAFPSRVIAAEIAEAAMRQRSELETPCNGILTSDRSWFPNVANSFEGIQSAIEATVKDRFSVLPRRQRRAAAKHLRHVDYTALAREAAPEMAAEFGLPLEAITDSLVPYLSGKISGQQASKRLFRAFAEPVKFVETYFEKVVSDRSLPEWIGKTGREFQTNFAQLRDTLRPFTNDSSARSRLRTLLAEHIPIFGQQIANLGSDDVAEFGVTPALRDALLSDPEFAMSLPACQIFGCMVSAYAGQVIGLQGGQPSIEDSFAGDLMHSLYLPHVDLWRGDRRYSAIAAQALPAYANRIVSRLSDLPASIDRWQNTISV